MDVNRFRIFAIAGSLATLACGSNDPGNELGSGSGSEKEVAVSEIETKIELGSIAPRNCRVTNDMQVCLRSDFERAIDLEIANQSSDAVELSHSFAFYNGTISLFDAADNSVGGELWEPSPVPNRRNPSVTPYETASVQFNGENTMDWVPLNEVVRICYRTGATRAGSTATGKLLRVCLDKG